MTRDGLAPLERFQVCGNILKVTPRFDPRYQSRAGTELINIVSSLAAERNDPEVILDITDAAAIPSMMIGILFEASSRTGKAGKKFRIRLKKAAYDRLRELGLSGVFTQNPVQGDADGMELVADRRRTGPEEQQGE